MEILNFHANKNLSLKILIKENTTNYVLWNSLKVINLGRLVISTYSVMNDTPSRAFIWLTNNLTLPDIRSSLVLPSDMTIKPFTQFNLSSSHIQRLLDTSC